jgi:hypothetical protein
VIASFVCFSCPPRLHVLHASFLSVSFEAKVVVFSVSFTKKKRPTRRCLPAMELTDPAYRLHSTPTKIQTPSPPPSLRRTACFFVCVFSASCFDAQACFLSKQEHTPASTHHEIVCLSLSLCLCVHLKTLRAFRLSPFPLSPFSSRISSLT